MNSKKQILLTGFIFIVIFSLLFFSIREEYSIHYEITNNEVDGINEITDIYQLDILIKSIRGLSQLSRKDSQSIKSSLFIDEDNVLKGIKKLKDKEIETFYKKTLSDKDNVSKMKTFRQYSKLLRLLNNKRIDRADSSSLLFEADREIYFLIITTVLDIPYIIENIGKVRALGILLQDERNTNTNTNTRFLLDANLKAFTDKIEDIKYTINKLNPNDKNKLNSLLNLLISDFYNVNIIVEKVKKGTLTLNSKEYFLETSKLVNKIYDFFATSKDILTVKLVARKRSLENKLLLGTIFYALLISTILFVVFLNYRDYDKQGKRDKRNKKQNKFIQQLHENYTKDTNLRETCTQSLKSLIDYFNPINGSLYLFNEENEKLYLGGVYGIKHDSLNHTLDINENLIAENILEQKIKIFDIDKELDVGNMAVNATKLVTIPMRGFEKSVGTIQLAFDNKFKQIDIEFLQSVVSLMGDYIYKAQKDEESERYLKLIDKNVLISKTDVGGKIIDVSEQLCELSQYSKEELLSGVTHRVFKHKDTSKDVILDIWATITKGNIWHGELKNRKKGGGFYWIDSYIAPDIDINGNIIGYTAIRTDITDKKKIEQIAITDGLTSLYNRRHFDTLFPQQIAINKRAKGLLVFVLKDIDHFKQYNDTYGHQDGDTTLKRVARALTDSLKRPDDYTFRLGGEEFGLLYHIQNEEEAILIANKARENIENLKIEHTGNSASKFVTISSGLYIIKSDDNATVDDIYKTADNALYKAKQSGRNKVSS